MLVEKKGDTVVVIVSGKEYFLSDSNGQLKIETDNKLVSKQPNENTILIMEK